MVEPSDREEPRGRTLVGAALPEAGLPHDATARVDEALAVAETAAWLDRVVIGLRLCPFARSARSEGRTRIVASRATDVDGLLTAFSAELRRLLATPVAQLETTLLVHPWALTDFDAYNDFLDLAESTLDAMGANGVVQVASFHPHYRFAGTRAEDVSNATNRSPYPMLQLLREASVSAAVDALPDPASIYEANIKALRRLGAQRWEALQSECRDDALKALGRPVPKP